jgi:hypothetical protein
MARKSLKEMDDIEVIMVALCEVMSLLDKQTHRRLSNSNYRDILMELADRGYTADEE